ncbi:MAG TPA: hypothetical protein VGK17_20790 [Propionicimonas sp.]|jgi:hypothetical protein
MSRASVPPEFLRDIVDRYATEGYAPTSSKALPAELLGVDDADLVFVRGDEIVLVQFKRSPAIVPARDQSEKLSRLAQQIRRFPTIRLDVINVPDPMDVLPDRELILSRADAAAGLARDAGGLRDVEAALLLAASAMEGALIRLLRDREIPFGADRGLADLAATAWSEGLMTQDQWEELQRAIDRRNAIAHGLTPGDSLTMADVETMVTMTRTFAAPGFQTALDLVNWFFERYEDPADGVPFVSSEGGYQYISGGPFDAREVLEAAFPETAEDVVALAVEQIEAYGSEWVAIGDY